MTASGKTAIGKLLSEQLNITLFESDSIIETQYHQSISEIFQRYGEANFRLSEEECIEDIIAAQDNFIFSLGGGAYLSQRTRDNIQNNNIFTICLESSAQTILERVKNDTSRPLLQTENPLETIKDLIKQRNKYYQEADLKINTDSGNKQLILEEIITKLQENNILTND